MEYFTNIQLRLPYLQCTLNFDLLFYDKKILVGRGS